MIVRQEIYKRVNVTLDSFLIDPFPLIQEGGGLRITFEEVRASIECLRAASGIGVTIRQHNFRPLPDLDPSQFVIGSIGSERTPQAYYDNVGN